MIVGMIGKKCGSSRVFKDDGTSVPVTVLFFDKNIISQIKTQDKDGYTALQIATGKVKKINKPEHGHFKKNDLEPKRYMNEFRVDASVTSAAKLGNEVSVDSFTEGAKVCVTGTSKGKGFQGCVKRWNFSMQDATHGNSLSHRAPGSIGQCQDPGKVFKGKKMAGQMGNVRKTVKNLVIVKIDAEAGIVLVKGAVPGANGGVIYMTAVN